ncbi:unnamed protein product [Penicillium olsonii]|nr:unnamed protein product [Penicillium olsonii]
MASLAVGLVAFLALSPFALTEKVGYLESTSCADPKGLVTCYKNAEERYTTCINENCGGGGEACSKSCGGSISCMNSKCPGLGIDCMNVCGAEQSALQMDCAGSHCWNQVYSCEYQDTVIGWIDQYPNPNRDGLPFFPAPDNAPGSCSCNLGKVDRKLYLGTEQMTKCSNNETNLNQFTKVDDITSYGKACSCCAFSSIISSIWDTCPDTKPSLLGADEWFSGVLNPGDWDECGPYLENYDCAGDLGFGREDAGAFSKFWSPTSMPTNGTKTASNIAGAITSPVSGNTFTWSMGETTNAFGRTTSPLIHTVTVTSANAVVTGKGKAQATSDGESTATGTSSNAAESETKHGIGSSLGVPSWTMANFMVAVLFSTF